MSVFIVTIADNVEHRVEAVNETAARNKVRVTDPTLGIVRVQLADAPDRAEQVKALIEESEGFDPHPRSAGGKNHTTQYAVLLVERLAAALIASEAEVTRLQAGIRRALTVENRHTDKAFYVIVGLMVAELEAALSQPTTDTKGAHA